MALQGYDTDFLGVPVAIPRPLGDRQLRDLPYPHFSVVLDADRRLAAATAVNIDGAALVRPRAHRRLGTRSSCARVGAGRAGALRRQRPRSRAPRAAPRPRMGHRRRGARGERGDLRLHQRRAPGIRLQSVEGPVARSRGSRPAVRRRDRPAHLGVHGAGPRRGRPAVPRRADPPAVLEGRRVDREAPDGEPVLAAAGFVLDQSCAHPAGRGRVRRGPPRFVPHLPGADRRHRRDRGDRFRAAARRGRDARRRGDRARMERAAQRPPTSVSKPGRRRTASPACGAGTRGSPGCAPRRRSPRSPAPACRSAPMRPGLP